MTNPLRKNAIQLVSDVWFDRVVNSVIIINCLYIAMEGEDFDFIKYTANVDAMFLAFYSFFFLIQIIALGFVARQYTTEMKKYMWLKCFIFDFYAYTSKSYVF